jgi:diguanylate cyclase (GGDEF)-like protein/PAS domain S-box-containing protein
MNAAQTIVVLILMLATGLSLTLALRALHRRQSPGMTTFSLLMFGTTVWAFGYLLELVSPTLTAKLVWVNIQYIGICTIPLFWFLFSYRFTGFDWHSLPLPLRVLIFGLPIFSILLSFTSSWHDWLRTDLRLPAEGAFGELGKNWGPWFWVIVVYSYLLITGGAVLLIYSTFQIQRVYRLQRILLVATATLPLAGNLLYITQVITAFDPTPLAFAMAGGTIGMGIFRLRFLELVPVAREVVLESLLDGVVVFDERGRVVDANPAAALFLGLRLEEIAGKTALEIFSPWPDVCEKLASQRVNYSAQVELRSSWYDLRLEAVRRKDGAVLGRMVVLRDITALHQAETHLRALNESLDRRVQQRTAELSQELANRRQAEAALIISEERYALAARGANDGLWDWDVRSGSVFYSARWCEIFGLGCDEMVGSINEWFNRIHPDDVDHVRRELDTHLRGDSADFISEHRIRDCADGECWVLARGQAVFDPQGTPLRMAGSFSDISARKKAEGQLVFNAMHDALTGMPNRALFLDRLGLSIERLRRNPDYQFAVLYLDFDRFKLINDSLGHNIGDLLLVASARRMENAVRAIDTAARFGGDEFVILLDDIHDHHDALRVTERIQQELGVVFHLEGYQIYNSASVGIVFSQADYERPDDVLRDADIAMYHAKLQGRARYAIFDTTMRERTHTRLEIETDLRQALGRGELALHYQPLVALETNRVYGFEALLRWDQPGRSPVSPADFIPVAEETGLILPIGRWVLGEACRQMQAWRERYPAASTLAVSVNVSARQLAQGTFGAEVADVLRETGLPASSLRLELTESALIDESEVVSAAIEQLHELGVSLHLDDFGTGYSSLSYLHRYKVDALKIDRSFITRMGPESKGEDIVRTILSLARELNLEVVAEGVETPQQMAVLRQLRCGFGQGYWIARPAPADKVEELIQMLD